MNNNLKELSLFTGAGGGLLGTKLLGFKHIGYVEINDYCQKIIAQRIKDGILNDAPIFGDIRTFISEGYAASYQGMVDVITAGFPCQPFSLSGKQRGDFDCRNMWPSTIECLRIIRPKYALLENVAGLLVNEYIYTIFGDLAESGYDANWCMLGGYASDSCCEGERLWIVVTEANSAMLESLDFSQHIFACQEEPCRRQYTRAISEMLSQDDYSKLKRDTDAVARGMDRLETIGNGQVPILVKTAWELLVKRGKI